MNEADPIQDEELDDFEDIDQRPMRPRLEDFGLEQSDLYEVSMEIARITDANRPLTPHSVEQSGDSLILAALAAMSLPAYLAGGILVMLAAMALAVGVGCAVLWGLDGGYRRFTARRYSRPDLETKVRAFLAFERALYDWRICESKSYPLGLSRQTDGWIRCWWNRRGYRFPDPIAYGRTKRSPLNGNWQPWDCLDGNQQNIVRFLFWRTRSSRMEFAFKLLLTVALSAALLVIVGFRSLKGQ